MDVIHSPRPNLNMQSSLQLQAPKFAQESTEPPIAPTDIDLDEVEETVTPEKKKEVSAPAKDSPAPSADPRDRERQEVIDVFSSVEQVVQQLLYGSGAAEKNHPSAGASWSASVCAWHGRAHLGWPFHLLITYTIIFCYIFHERADDIDSSFVQTVRSLPPTPLKLCSVGLLMLVVFRTQTSYQKWSQSRQVWQDLTVTCRALAMQSKEYMHDRVLASRICRYLIVYVISVRSWLRCEDLDFELVRPLITAKALEYLIKISADGDEYLINASADEHVPMKKETDNSHLDFTFKRVCLPLEMLEIMREILAEAVQQKKVGPFHMAMEANIKALGSSLAIAERILGTQIPFAYLSHLRTTLLLFGFQMPFFLVRDLGWFTLFAVAFFIYVSLGLENLATEIENPFGRDANDLPLDRYCAMIARDVRDIMKRNT